MEETTRIIFNVDAIYLIGAIITVSASLITLAYTAGARLTKLESSIEKLEDGFKDIKVSLENKNIGAFASHSPVSLTEVGKKALEESGFKAHIDSRTDALLAACESKKNTNAYEVQEYIIEYFDAMTFDEQTENALKTYAFEHGLSMEMLRRIGAYYFRDICLNRFDMNPNDIDSDIDSRA